MQSRSANSHSHIYNAGADAGFLKGGGSNLGLEAKRGVQLRAQCQKAYMVGQRRVGGGGGGQTPVFSLQKRPILRFQKMSLTIDFES